MSEASKPTPTVEPAQVQRIDISSTAELALIAINLQAPTFESATGKSELLATTGGRYASLGTLPDGREVEVQVNARVVKPKAPRKALGISYS